MIADSAPVPGPKLERVEAWRTAVGSPSSHMVEPQIQQHADQFLHSLEKDIPVQLLYNPYTPQSSFMPQSPPYMQQPLLAEQQNVAIANLVKQGQANNDHYKPAAGFNLHSLNIGHGADVSPSTPVADLLRVQHGNMGSMITGISTLSPSTGLLSSPTSQFNRRVRKNPFLGVGQSTHPSLFAQVSSPALLGRTTSRDPDGEVYQKVIGMQLKASSDMREALLSASGCMGSLTAQLAEYFTSMGVAQVRKSREFVEKFRDLAAFIDSLQTASRNSALAAAGEMQNAGFGNATEGDTHHASERTCMDAI